MKKTILFFIALALLGTMGITSLTWAQIQPTQPKPYEPLGPPAIKGVVPIYPAKKVFVTSQTYSGNLGGLPGAAQMCQQLANAAGLKGIFKAWLSDSLGNCPAHEAWFTHSQGPYVLVNGKTVANNWADLTKGSIATPINVTEKGQIIQFGQAPYEPFVWTNTTWAGQPAAPPPDTDRSPCRYGYYNFCISASCANWTSSNAPYNPRAEKGDCGFVGSLENRDSQWTQWTEGTGNPCLGYHGCSVQYHLYCFQQ